MDGGDESCPSRASRGGLNFGPERPNTPAQCQHSYWTALRPTKILVGQVWAFLGLLLGTSASPHIIFFLFNFFMISLLL